MCSYVTSPSGGTRHPSPEPMTLCFFPRGLRRLLLAHARAPASRLWRCCSLPDALHAGDDRSKPRATLAAEAEAQGLSAPEARSLADAVEASLARQMAGSDGGRDPPREQAEAIDILRVLRLALGRPRPRRGVTWRWADERRERRARRTSSTSSAGRGRRQPCSAPATSRRTTTSGTPCRSRATARSSGRTARTGRRND